ncbi:hypothetical protein BDV59DRAFT_183309 [Aspergillus ambiguus]|uniref:uncharacterized protein n=1 Tax=Aspergillus ambiguus TaxID=176160 RepID=UPI003CCC9673
MLWAITAHKTALRAIKFTTPGVGVSSVFALLKGTRLGAPTVVEFTPVKTPSTYQRMCSSTVIISLTSLERCGIRKLLQLVGRRFIDHPCDLCSTYVAKRNDAKRRQRERWVIYGGPFHSLHPLQSSCYSVPSQFANLSTGYKRGRDVQVK